MSFLSWQFYLVLLILGFAGPVLSQVVRHGDCSVDAEVWSLPQCALEARDGRLYVSKPYLRLFFPTEKARLVGRMIPNGGWAYFDRHGLIVVQQVANFDNGPDPFDHGLVRTVAQGKWGLANSKGYPVVPLKYDGILGYEESHRGWLACSGCRTVSDGEHSWSEGGDWFWLDRHGKVAGKAEDPMTSNRSGNK